MGGKALKTAYTERCSNEKYISLSRDLLNKLEVDFERVSVVKNYRSKKTHGDIDILCGVSDFDFDFDTYIKETFNPVEIFHNGNCHSFDYEDTQIDLIECECEDFETYEDYYNFGLGNFLGKIARSIGFKFGMGGLWINLYKNNEKYKIPVSKDSKKIYDFLGYDYERYKNGFEKLEDIYDYILSSKYFNSDIFKIENLSKINRDRDVRRKSYMSFLDYIKDKGSNRAYNPKVIKDMKENVIEVIRRCFPEANIDLHLAQIEYNSARKRLVNMKFNGKILKEKYDISGKELGESIVKFKEYIKIVHQVSFNTFIVDMDIDYIYSTYEAANYEGD